VWLERHPRVREQRKENSEKWGEEEDEEDVDFGR
jgi:hypothetical protein